MHFKLLSNIITLGIIVCMFTCVESAESSNAQGAGSSNDTAISEKKPSNYDVSFFSGSNFCFSVLLLSAILLFLNQRIEILFATFF